MTPDNLADMPKVDIAIHTASSITAAGAVSAPVWYPTFSEGTAIMLQMLGIVLVSLQIIYYVRRIWGKNP